MDGLDNREAVWNFFSDNPCHSRIECAAALDLSRQTVNKHAAAIKDGWRPEFKIDADIVECVQCGRVPIERMAKWALCGCGVVDHG